MNETLLEKLQQQIATVLLMYRVVKEKNETLRTTNKELNEQLEHNKKTIENLQQNYNELQMAKAVIDSSGEAAEAKKHIEEIVREVDECIALLQ
jgi:methyl-accepting chemotaxis protein